MNLKDYLFRCSSLGKIMTGAKPNLTENQQDTLMGLMDKKADGKITDKQLITLGDLIKKRDASPSLSRTAINYLDQVIQEEVFGRTHEIRSKYLDKGLSVEEQSFSLYTKVANLFLTKNEQRFRNDWITGEPDNTQGKVRDIKSSWDFSTFPLNATEIPNSDYEWQVIGYMELTGLKEAELVYCLVDTPSIIIDDELRRLQWKLGYMDLDMMPKEIKIETIMNHIYTEQGLIEYCHQSSNIHLDWFGQFKPITDHQRVKVFELDYDYSKVKLLYSYLQLAREYLLKSQVNILEQLQVA